MKPLSGVSIEKQLETLMAHGLSPERAVDMIVTGILRLTRRGNLLRSDKVTSIVAGTFFHSGEPSRWRQS